MIMRSIIFTIVLFFFFLAVSLQGVYADGGIKPYDCGSFCFAYDSSLFQLKTKEDNVILKTHEKFTSNNVIETPWVMVINLGNNELDISPYFDEQNKPKNEVIKLLILEVAKKDNPAGKVKISQKKYFDDSAAVFCSVFDYKYEEENRTKTNYFIFRNKKLYYAVGLSSPKDFKEAKLYFDDLIKSFSFN